LDKHFLNDFGLVVVDEFHVLYDKLRGYNLEKLLSILKESETKLICIPATIESKQEIGEWLDARVIYFPNEYRPVDLIHEVIDLSDGYSHTALCKAIIARHNEPYLIFCSTKPNTQRRAVAMCDLLPKTVNDEQEMIEEVKKAISREELPELESILCSCLSKGVGFHHSDLHGAVRNFVADLFRQRRINYLFCTTGLAYGINFPARAVVVVDLTLWDYEARRSNPIPPFLYVQMAGRAGRPQYDKVGFCYFVAKNEDDLKKFVEYKKGELPRAISRIDIDEYFRKAILELVYSRRNTDKEIIDFFENSLFNFQAVRKKDALLPYNLLGLIKKRIEWLHGAGFVERLGLTYRLTDLGLVTLEYLFRGFSSPELSAFIQLDQYLGKQGTADIDFQLILFLSRVFAVTIPKQPYKRSKEVEDFLQNMGITEKTSDEYSAYVVFNKWIRNVHEADIDDACKVYSSNLPSKMWEM